MAIQTKMSAWLRINQIKKCSLHLDSNVFLLLCPNNTSTVLAGNWTTGNLQWTTASATLGQVNDHVAKEKKNVCLKQSSKGIASLLHRLSPSLINKIIRENEWTWKCYFFTCLCQGVKILLFFRNQEDWG